MWIWPARWLFNFFLDKFFFKKLLCEFLSLFLVIRAKRARVHVIFERAVQLIFIEGLVLVTSVVDMTKFNIQILSFGC